VGTGFGVKSQNEDVVFKIGFSHQVVFKKVAGVTYAVEGNNKVIVSGSDKQLVGQVAHKIKALRKPDPYKGKGIRYEGEKLKLKPGKKAKTAGA
jgi:large subunit ribosomal protein L6